MAEPGVLGQEVQEQEINGQKIQEQDINGQKFQEQEFNGQEFQEQDINGQKVQGQEMQFQEQQKNQTNLEKDAKDQLQVVEAQEKEAANNMKADGEHLKEASLPFGEDLTQETEALALDLDPTNLNEAENTSNVKTLTKTTEQKEYGKDQKELKPDKEVLKENNENTNILDQVIEPNKSTCKETKETDDNVMLAEQVTETNTSMSVKEEKESRKQNIVLLPQEENNEESAKLLKTEHEKQENSEENFTIAKVDKSLAKDDAIANTDGKTEHAEDTTNDEKAREETLTNEQRISTDETTLNDTKEEGVELSNTEDALKTAKTINGFELEEENSMMETEGEQRRQADQSSKVGDQASKEIEDMRDHKVSNDAPKVEKEPEKTVSTEMAKSKPKNRKSSKKTITRDQAKPDAVTLETAQQETKPAERDNIAAETKDITTTEKETEKSDVLGDGLAGTANPNEVTEELEPKAQNDETDRENTCAGKIIITDEAEKMNEDIIPGEHLPGNITPDQATRESSKKVFCGNEDIEGNQTERQVPHETINIGEDDISPKLNADKSDIFTKVCTVETEVLHVPRPVKTFFIRKVEEDENLPKLTTQTDKTMRAETSLTFETSTQKNLASILATTTITYQVNPRENPLQPSLQELRLGGPGGLRVGTMKGLTLGLARGSQRLGLSRESQRLHRF